ncbi:elongation factor P hydroxylase [Aestuariibacter salexigens]|uniref:elongation factor P hydroxylase n=1 Tax=Aestuariibacter salexigens TaxID=226010 RepID=UPI000402077B|nr:elongation factor P hydroxylase [Aestuariibacter salexigens]
MVSAQQSDVHCIDELIALFEQAFFADHNTRLVKGDDEPLYLPATKPCEPHQIIFAHGFFSSALHEIAHWCLAGEQRRQQVDYGYWYCPDGRNEQQQQAFEQVEVKPQAIEWAFSVASAHPFRVSTDNLDGVTPDRKAFAMRVFEQVTSYLQEGFPPRAQQFINCLSRRFHTAPLTLKQFDPEVAGA